MRNSKTLVPLLSGTLFTSAFLLFWCQPMVGKMVLPALGGAAAVWTTCVLFFQAVLLLGYVYAHALGRFLDTRKQIIVHAGLLLVPLAFLPIRFDASPAEASHSNPVLWLMGQLIVAVGVPFFAVSATAPLLQNWFSSTEHTAAADPYFLYSASNAGSLLALLAYPFVMEPATGVQAQSALWLAGYLALAVLLAAASAMIWPRATGRSAGAAAAAEDSPRWNRRLLWVAAAFVPSALMLAVTNHITANLASAPFLWVAPLAVYLLTFIFAFGRRFRSTPAQVSRQAAIFLLAFFPFVAADVIAPPGVNWLLIGGHIVLLYFGALLCHTVLAASRPATRYLTEFYFWIALAGVLGGAFTATIAPMLFDTVLEYPLLVLLLPFFRVQPPSTAPASAATRRLDFLLPAALAALLFALWGVFGLTGIDENTEVLAFAHTAFLFAAFKLMDRARRFALAFAVLLIGYGFALPRYLEEGGRLHVDRNFFGVKKVSDNSSGSSSGYRWLTHGDTLHGMESLEPARRGEPISYYHATGPVGEIVRMLEARNTTLRFGVLGLGSGTMAAYGGADTRVTFYEIDPDVEATAREYFSFLSKCGSNCNVVVGDGRLRLAEEPGGAFDLLMLDAFSSDAVPAHLLSREALQLYISKTKPDGIILFNVSNRYLRVDKLVGELLRDAGLSGFSRFDEAGPFRAEGKTNSTYAIAARDPAHLGLIAHSEAWKAVVATPGFRPWTDDYSNLLSIIRWY